MTISRALPILFLGLLVLAGCGQQNPVADTGASGTDPAAQYAAAPGVETEATALPDEFDVLAYEDGTDAKPDIADPAFAVSGGTTVDAAIDPAFWFRLIRERNRRYIVEFEHPDDMTFLARVQVIDRLLGSFNIAARPETLDTGEIIQRHLVSKRLADTAVRRAVFARHRIMRDGNADPAAADTEDAEDGYRDGWSRWHLVALSGHEITSDDGTRSIESVRIQSGPVDVTVTDPLELKRVRQELIHLPPATPVMLTVQTGDPNDVVVMYTRWGRMRLRQASRGVWQGRFMTPAELGLRHLAVNALSQGTIFDDAAPYDSKAWGIPFVVAPPLTAQN